MNHDLPLRERLTDRTTKPDPETPEIERARARTLAMIANHVPAEMTQAAGELPQLGSTGEAGISRQDAVLEAIPESQRWEPVPGSEGQQAAESPSEGEDDEGRSATEQLFDDGAAAADRERMSQAREDEKRK